ncbi:N-acetylmuramoyl-L-alanine amidase [bacterium]|nr:N-acetylmuramoyl-L-alanine amidase [bacterium]
MALLGKSFNSYVADQVKIRQKVLAQSHLDVDLSSTNIIPTKVLKSLNTNTPWIRMASSVNITKGNTSAPGTSIYKQIEDNNTFEGFNWKEDNLAKNFVLFNGVNKGGVKVKNGDDVGGVKYMPTGNTGNPLQKAYGFGYSSLGGENSRGPVPLPGIQSVDFSYKNDGALAQATVKVKCFSPEQFQMIDILFQRPGYTVLLEFGHTVFLDNKGDIQYAGEGDYNYSTDPFNTLYKKSTATQTFFNLHDVIAREKSKWDGNYEAFYGKISKFNWSFNKDGSYDITVNLVGMGDIISSLKMNTTPPKIEFLKPEEVKVQYEKLKELTGDPIAVKIEKEAFLAAYIKKFKDLPYKITKKLPAINFDLDGYEYFTKPTGKNFWSGNDIGFEPYKLPTVEYASAAFLNDSSETIQNSLSSTFNYELRRIYDKTTSKLELDGTNDAFKGYYSTYPRVRVDQSEGGISTSKKGGVAWGSSQAPVLSIHIPKDSEEEKKRKFEGAVYINFITLLSILQQYSNLYTDDTPLITYDFDFDAPQLDNNYIKTYPGQFSSDPSKILIPYSGIPLDIRGNGLNLPEQESNKNSGTPFNTQLKKSHFFTEDLATGRLAYVYLNTDYLSGKYANSIDGPTGQILALDFLRSVLKDIDDNLGNLNNFKVIHDKDSNLIKILSETPLGNSPPELTKINTYGVTNTEGSFIKSLSLDSELSDNYATQVSVGAQNNGSNSQSNGLSFSTYNKGLIDRIIPNKTDSGDVKTSKEDKKNLTEEQKKAAAAIADKKISDYWDNLRRNEDGSVSTDAEGKPISDMEWNRILNEKTLLTFEAAYISLNWDSETLSTLKDLSNNITNYITGNLIKTRKMPLPFFLPFNLKLEMSGLSGMQIYNSFEVDGKVLPLTYNPNSIYLTIKSLSHTVDSNGWVTKIETLPRPKTTSNPTKIKTSSPNKVKSPYKKASSGGGRKYTQFVAGGEITRDISGKTKSLTRGYDMTNLFWTPQVRQPVKQFYLHYTVTPGGPGPGKWFKSVIDGWNGKSSDHISTPYLLDDEGNVEVLYNDVTSYGNHLGRPQLHKISSAVEILNWGYLKKKGNKYYSGGTEIPLDRVCTSVDKNGNPAPYKDQLYWHKMTDAQIEAIRKLTLEVCAKFNIPLIFSYDDCFPKKGTLSDKAMAGTPGIYTHNSVEKGKFDIHPQKELIDMLKGLQTKQIYSKTDFTKSTQIDVLSQK